MKHFLTALLLASVLLVTGCADPYYEKLEDLEYRVAELQKTCDQINSDLLALQSLVSAIEKKDMITGVTELRSGTTLLGYRINFVDHAAVTISNGKDGNKPLVASQRDPEDGNWYWTVQYGDGTAEWLLAPDGSKKDEPMELCVGDTVLYGKYAGTEITVDGKDYLIMRQSDVVAVLK